MTSGEAGGSARVQFDRRRRRHREQVGRQRPRIVATSVMVVLVGLALTLGSLGSSWRLVGGFTMVVGVLYAVVSFYVLPGHVRAWRTGADGEVETARILDPLVAAGFVVLHDRRIPNGRENIDHIVIGPTGVFVIETKNYAGELRVRDGNLYVDGRRRAGVIDQVSRQANAVSAVLDGVPVSRLVVIHRADFPLIRRPSIDGVPIVRATALGGLIGNSPVALDPAEVDRLATLASVRLRPMT